MSDDPYTRLSIFIYFSDDPDTPNFYTIDLCGSRINPAANKLISKLHEFPSSTSIEMEKDEMICFSMCFGKKRNREGNAKCTFSAWTLSLGDLYVNMDDYHNWIKTKQTHQTSLEIEHDKKIRLFLDEVKNKHCFMELEIL